MSIVEIIGLAVVAAEIGLAAAIWWLRRDCPWLITANDLEPKIDANGLDRFMAHGWDRELGWVRKPDTAHDEPSAGDETTRYHNDADGARRNPGFGGGPLRALVYGDSYAFCRQVNDDGTWPHVLSRKIGGDIANYGVGNYGLDQALMRLEREFDDHPAPVVVMAVVPETISRVLSVWKHFSEYGNVFAFKPRFRQNGDMLELVPNPVMDRDRFFRIGEMLPELKQLDFFYTRKFAPDLLRFPYLYHLWRSRRRNVPLIVAAIADRLGGVGKRAFCRVMERNIALAAALYHEDVPRDLMVAITDRFANFVRSKGAEPVLVMLPQLYDLKRLRAGDHYYAPFMDRAATMLQTVDLGPIFAADPRDGRNYIDDAFGGHFSAAGNTIVAEQLKQKVFSVQPARSVG